MNTYEVWCNTILLAAFTNYWAAFGFVKPFVSGSSWRQPNTNYWVNVDTDCEYEIKKVSHGKAESRTLHAG